MKRRANQAKSDRQQLSLFDVPPQPRPEPGALDMCLAIREALVDTLAGASMAGMDRHDVAAQISRLSSHDMSKNMLDQYCAPSSDKRFPADAIPALIVATGNYKMLEAIATACGCKVYRGEEAHLAELGALTMQDKLIKARLADAYRSMPESLLQRLLDDKLVGGRGLK
ncbi:MULTISPECIES: hypothetical protein [Ralstonia solanacearum species complex]|uniref:hypothetical protein n=1 Tax=Ralstonia solanacearum species complex TaxID=3116862 RepID=UPI000E579E5E|nr:hypothetical protein [Ralstonia solanacearum]BEU74010.1 hypothetical protein MAFF211271_35650 [Ralstonia pseudosolanacearum]AXV78917.1 hypothetical protein CJO76_18135 [Ralstonia solanacearum]AXV92939.1 hypothetical protein CJO79_18120 [Ralstonia solanacearum]AXW21002.1 hypothetical protein CJO85_18165 [Ralstonia solanacearum]AXW77837.1 hypothetical protein CJO97_18115 [Ralstonia solanacearum]